MRFIYVAPILLHFDFWLPGWVCLSSPPLRLQCRGQSVKIGFSGQVSNTSAGTILVQTGRIAHCTAVHNLAGRGNNNGELCKECTVAINSICVILTCDLPSVSTHTN